MHSLAALPAVRGGFIHIPYLPEQAARHPGAASMSLEQMVEGMRVAVRTALAVELDLLGGGGSTH
jgi:pyroglutamyl-peptidase